MNIIIHDEEKVQIRNKKMNDIGLCVTCKILQLTFKFVTNGKNSTMLELVVNNDI